MRPDGLEVTDDAILNGRLRLYQPRRGHRFGHDAILLAAAVPAQPGEAAVELGSGVGAASLALLSRVPDVSVTLIEREQALSTLARDNVLRNGFGRRAQVIRLDVTKPLSDFAAAGLQLNTAGQVLMNPPFNDPRHQASPDALRRAAHHAGDGILPIWLARAHALLRIGGTLTVIWRADDLETVLTNMRGDFGSVEILPVRPSPDRPPIRVLVRARKGARASQTTHPALVLNDQNRRPTAAAEAVLRDGAALLADGAR